MENWTIEMQVEALNSKLLAHEIIVYNVSAGNQKMTEEDVISSRGLIIQYVRRLLATDNPLPAI